MKMKQRIFSVLAVLALVMVLLAPDAKAQTTGLDNSLTVDVLPATLVKDTTVTTSAPNVDSQGRDVSLNYGWQTADIFVTAVMSPTGILTATVQVSADGVNWASAYSEYWTGSAIGTQTKRVILASAGTNYVPVVLAGDKWRVSLLATGSVTATVKATLNR
jgi:hypothetical protein